MQSAIVSRLKKPKLPVAAIASCSAIMPLADSSRSSRGPNIASGSTSSMTNMSSTDARCTQSARWWAWKLIHDGSGWVQ